MGLLMTLHPWKVRLGCTPAVHPDLWNLCMDREDTRSGKYAGSRRPLMQHCVRRGNGQECQRNHSFHILHCGQEFQHCLNGHAVNHQYKHLYTSYNSPAFCWGFFPCFDGTLKWEIMRSSLRDNPSVTLMGGFGLWINSLRSADSVLWRVVSPGALAAWQVPHLTEARLNVLDRSIALPGVLHWQQNA